ncbi:MAG: J domain-containing protein [Rhodoferax sp.]|nr:J domain-containing protein [Rhodoferax sp.]
MDPLTTYYDTLQVSRCANGMVIKAAYRILSQKFHPDKNPDGVERGNIYMKRLNEAYEVLSDAARRGRYDFLVQQREELAREKEYLVQRQQQKDKPIGRRVNASAAASYRDIAVFPKMPRRGSAWVSFHA